MNSATDGIFDVVRDYPDPEAQRQLAALVGLDDVKSRLLKQATVLLRPAALTRWATKHHTEKLAILKYILCRPPLFLFAGDVGTGKTALAESFGDAIARHEDIQVTLFTLSLTARGTGAVGQMTTLLSAAFAEVRREAQKSCDTGGARHRRSIILLIDEADALAQSREASQMHHEDRAGVNALIRGVDDLARRELPVVVVMCTNRLSAIDPAVRRRAAATFEFCRPNDVQRKGVLSAPLMELRFRTQDIDALVDATGPKSERSYGFTYSDLTQRFLPAIVLDAFPDKPVNAERALTIARQMLPTPPFAAALPHT